MYKRPDPLYVILRNGKRWRHFISRLSAITYLAACYDLCPGDKFDLCVVQIEEVYE